MREPNKIKKVKEQMRFQRYNYILLLVIASSFLNPSLASIQSSFCSSEEDFLESNPMATVLGGVKDSPASNSAEIDNLARFAVEEHNKKENKLLELARVIKVQEQVVAGTLHHLTLEVLDAGEKKIYQAKVWVKPWLNFKELQEFTHVSEPTTTTPDVEKDGESVAVHGDVQDAANHVLKTLQQRSNSLFPYELQEVVHVKSETVDGSAKYDLLLKVKRSDKEEKFKANVHKDKDGIFHVNNMVQDHS